MYSTTWKPLAFRVARHVAGDAKLRLNHKLKKVGATRFERATSCSQIGLGPVTVFVGFAVKHRKSLVFST